MRPLGLAMGHFAGDAEGFKLRFFSLEEMECPHG